MYTEPASEPTRSPKLLPAEPVVGRLVMVMALVPPLVPLVPGLVAPLA